MKAPLIVTQTSVVVTIICETELSPPEPHFRDGCTIIIR
jgi:hypothetical protein